MLKSTYTQRCTWHENCWRYDGWCIALEISPLFFKAKWYLNYFSTLRIIRVGKQQQRFTKPPIDVANTTDYAQLIPVCNFPRPLIDVRRRVLPSNNRWFRQTKPKSARCHTPAVYTESETHTYRLTALRSSEIGRNVVTSCSPLVNGSTLAFSPPWGTWSFAATAVVARLVNVSPRKQPATCERNVCRIIAWVAAIFYFLRYAH